MCSCIRTVVLSILCLLILESVYAQIGSSCTTPNQEWATCKSIYNCKVLLDVVKTRNANQLRFLRSSQCGYDRNPLVCCGTQNNSASSTSTERNSDSGNNPSSRITTPNSAIPDRSSCGFQFNDKIFGGNETSMEDFPWMALLEYISSSNNKRYSCGGSVISKRYILTAAHCITGEIVDKVGRLINVRLGEWDIRQDVDCITQSGIQICNKAPEDFGIEKTLVHPNYDTTSTNRYDDIALIKVNRDIKYSDYIRPACLPLPNESSDVGEKLFVAGWGKTQTRNQNPIKLKVEVPIAEKSRCTSTFRSAGVTLKSTQICAGGVKGKDSCGGDSGGPLMRTAKNDTSQWYIEGLVSFGAACGTEGWPGIYTKISDYLPWIYENVKE